MISKNHMKYLSKEMNNQFNHNYYWKYSMYSKYINQQDYTKVHSMNIPIDNWCVLQMIHYNLGYLMNLSRLLPFTDLKRLIEIKTIATYERSLG